MCNCLNRVFPIAEKILQSITIQIENIIDPKAERESMLIATTSCSKRVVLWCCVHEQEDPACDHSVSLMSLSIDFF